MFQRLVRPAVAAMRTPMMARSMSTSAAETYHTSVEAAAAAKKPDPRLEQPWMFGEDVRGEKTGRVKEGKREGDRWKHGIRRGGTCS